eukprot:1349973-Amorphochlora_amoeboformis.AAC.1
MEDKLRLWKRLKEEKRQKNAERGRRSSEVAARKKPALSATLKRAIRLTDKKVGIFGKMGIFGINSGVISMGKA